MTNMEKEIQAVYEKYAEQGLKDCAGMSIQEEKKYIDQKEPEMKKELNKIAEKYQKIDDDQNKNS